MKKYLQKNFLLATMPFGTSDVAVSKSNGAIQTGNKPGRDMLRTALFAKARPHALFCSTVCASLIALLSEASPGRAVVTIDNGQTVDVRGDQTGNQTSPWDIGDQLLVGDSTTGSLNILGGGSVSNNLTNIGNQSGSTGEVTVSGAGSKWKTSSDLTIGRYGTGTLSIEDGGAVTSYHGLIGSQAGGTGTVNVDGPDSKWTITDGLTIGVYTQGDGTLNITNGGTVSTSANTTALAIGNGSGSTGTVNVDGPGSTLNINGPSVVARSGTGTLNITNGGTVSATYNTIVALDKGSSGTVNVDGPGSAWTISGYLVVGYQGTGSLSITNGGAVSNGTGYISSEGGSTGTVTVDGAGSTWTNDGFLFVGSLGNGSLTIANGGVVSATFYAWAGASAGGTGAINIGAAQGDDPEAPGTLDTPTVKLGALGSLVFNHTDTNYSFDPSIAGTGQIYQLAGVTNLTGNSGSFSGTTSVTGGALLVNGILGNAASRVTVSSGGTLGGSGTIGGNVTIADGNLNPGNANFGGSVGTLTIKGNLALSNSSVLNYHFGEHDVVGGTLNDLVVVHGDLTLGGTLNVTTSVGGSFDPGIYRVISYDGSLIDNGLTLGTMPDGSVDSIQTSVDKQVNLVNTGGMTLTFWDGDAGPKYNDSVDGGNGIWQASGGRQPVGGNDNWTNDAGSDNAPYRNGAFAVFMGTAGIVTVDDSLGAVVSGGMQFATSGYLIQGGEITLADGSNLIRVGDGSTDGFGYVATIASQLVGPGGIDKSDAGTLVLTGANTYEGGTTITSGTLQLGDGGTTGSIVGDVLNNGI
ncbi:MAG: autotransporter-associated beta strand repeat-containing protein, partial [Desulfobulbus sp.]|nr:autotransporter-associated beta strand repeat-containing protein [Desulfobulbus sp.]